MDEHFVHALNIVTHVAAGSIALALGFATIFNEKGTRRHRQLGHAFFLFALITCVSAMVGSIFFRFILVFAILSVMVPYQLISGVRAARTRDGGPAAGDALLLVVAVPIAAALSFAAFTAGQPLSTIEYASLGSLWTILVYDVLRWTFPRHWHRTLWLYEHAYKMLATVFGMLSAMVGNVVRVGQPWSQLLPLAIGMVFVGYFFVQIGRRKGLSNSAELLKVTSHDGVA